ncbi:chitinase-3-like protein 1 [Aricia agestis]|uniref:chitinase-3-like protein 1 n=1 Tax=Aricia agestis TaxID=91739 RepID=UPI001C20B563|nr:chitinase-3-like protein 1 [Aricia agestis]
MLLYAAVLVTVLSFAAASEKKVVCYHGTWATYRSGLGQFDVTDIDPHLCTHVIYSFVGINDQGEVISLDPYVDLPSGKNAFRNFNALKKINPKLKTLLAVGGWNEGSSKYSTMAADASLRANFVKSALNMVLTYGFDGFDLDWEYPARRDTTHGDADVDNFTTLIKELRVQFDKYGLLLSAAVSPTSATASLSYDIPSISKYLDFINVMTYDMYGPWEAVVLHNSPLHRGEGQENEAREDVNSADVSLDYWLSQGCPPEKLLMGVPFYGHTFKLADASQSSVGAPSAGAGIAGPFTQEAGIIGYNEFCDMLQTQSWDVRYDPKAKVPYAVLGNDWVSYDDVDSMAKKVEYAISRGIGGVMLWSIETDDFHGICGEKFPLLNTINRVMANQIPTTKPTVAPSTAKPTVASSTSTTNKPSSTVSTTASISGICSKLGPTRNPADCSTYYMCVYDRSGGISPILMHCPKYTYWDQKHLYCNYLHETDCKV